jgi:hypothetical protein
MTAVYQKDFKTLEKLVGKRKIYIKEENNRKDIVYHLSKTEAYHVLQSFLAEHGCLEFFINKIRKQKLKAIK